MKWFATLFVGALLISCGSKPMATSKDEQGNEINNFGETIDADGAVSIAEMLKQLEGKDEVELKMRGTVGSVCQVKGCWMNLSQEGVDDEVFVKFKDYGFFMPMDLEGAEVVVRGKAYKEVTSVDELRHYAEDEGKSAEEIAAITEPQEELKFMADGVVVTKR